LYCNEGNELAYTKEFYQLLVRTAVVALIDLNPSDPDIWVNTELEQKRAQIKKDVIVLVSTYKDNAFLSRAQVEEIEYTKQIDLELRKVYGLGQYGRVTGTVFTNWSVIPEIPKDAARLIDGLDFGFTNDPTALVRIYKHNKALIMDCPIYETGLTNIDIYTEEGAKL
jgi:phage terminase large subunit